MTRKQLNTIVLFPEEKHLTRVTSLGVSNIEIVANGMGRDKTLWEKVLKKYEK